jgi:predicted amino acid racemase
MERPDLREKGIDLRHVLRVPCTEEMGLVERYKDLVDVVVFAAREVVVDGDRDIHGG